jgi:hypothetical protein
MYLLVKVKSQQKIIAHSDVSHFYFTIVVTQKSFKGEDNLGSPVMKCHSKLKKKGNTRQTERERD